MPSPHEPLISVMLAVADASRAVEWYERALGATQLWNLGSVVGLEIHGAPFFVGEPANNGWGTRHLTRWRLKRMSDELRCRYPRWSRGAAGSPSRSGPRPSPRN